MSRYQTGLDPYSECDHRADHPIIDQQTEVTLRISEMTAAVQLIQALGGGWDESQLPAAPHVTSEAAAKKASGN